MKFTPKTNEEIAMDGLIPDKAICDFEIVAGYDKTSKAGNEMIELKINVFDSSGRGRIINDYIMEKIPHKLRHACEACGLLDNYNSGSLMGSDFTGRTGRCKIGVDQGSADFPLPKNKIVDYIKPSGPIVNALTKDVFNDEVPF